MLCPCRSDAKWARPAGNAIAASHPARGLRSARIRRSPPASLQLTALQPSKPRPDDKSQDAPDIATTSDNATKVTNPGCGAAGQGSKP
jgi:hypothetical protein